MKKLFSVLLAFPVLCPLLPAQEASPVLKEDQKKELLDNLTALKEGNSKQKFKQAQAGISVLSSLAADPNAAMDLYLKCHRKMEFDDNNRPEKEWKQWKNDNKDQINSAANKRAIQFQSRWAVETLKAFMEGERYKPERYIPQALALIKEIMLDKDVVIKSQGPFNGSIMDGPIGKMHHLDGCAPDQWEGNIVTNPAGVINQLYLAPAIKDKNAARVREGWNMIISIVIRRSDLEAQDSPPKKPEEHEKRKAEITSILSLLRELDSYDAGDELRSMTNAINLVKQQRDPKTQESMIRMTLDRLERTQEKQP